MEFYASGEGRHRYKRLQEVFEYARARLGAGLAERIVSIGDHAGVLKVQWKDEPTDDERRVFEAAWESVCELAMNVSHELAP